MLPTECFNQGVFILIGELDPQLILLVVFALVWCTEWVLVDAAAHAYSMTSVPLYDTLGPDAVEYICNHAELAMVACSTAVLPTMMQCIARCPTLKLLVG